MIQQEEEIAMRQAVLPEITLLRQGSPIITLLGLLEGEILTYLEDCPVTTVCHLSRVLGQAPSMVMMAVGALIRAGLVLAHPSNLEVVVESAA